MKKGVHVSFIVLCVVVQLVKSSTPLFDLGVTTGIKHELESVTSDSISNLVKDTGDNVNQAVKDTGDVDFNQTVKDTGDNVNQAVKDTGDNVNQTVKDTGDDVNQTVTDDSVPNNTSLPAHDNDSRSYPSATDGVDTLEYTTESPHDEDASSEKPGAEISLIDILAANTAFLDGGSAMGGVDYVKGDVVYEAGDGGEVAAVTTASRPYMYDGHNDAVTDVYSDYDSGESTEEPEPYHGQYKYSNRIWVRGHRRGAGHIMPSVLHEALWNGHVFRRRPSIRVTVLETHFISYKGDKVTELTYTVTYEGRLVTRYVVDQVLKVQEARLSLADGMAGQDMMPYDVARSTSRLTHHSWAYNHRTVLIITGSMLGLLLVLTVLSAVCRRRSIQKGKKKMPKGDHCSRTSKKKMFENLESPPAYSAVNPGFTFQTGSVMDGQSLP